MLELDLLLQKYVNTHYSEASNHEKLLFTELLKNEDQDLFQWFLKSKNAPIKYQNIVNTVLHVI